LRSMRRIATVFIGTAALLAGIAADAKTKDGFGTALEEVEKLVAASSSGPAIVIGVTDRERLRGMVVHGYADLKAKKPATAETRFAIGSISKSFTAVVLLQMADEAKFDPSAPVSRYLPQFRVSSSFPQITGRSLLNHTSGLPNYLPHLSSMRYALYALHDFQPTYAAGEHFEYSNTGYQLLGYVAERIDGDAFASILGRRVLAPLGMRATEPQMDDAVRQSLAVSYERWPHDRSYVEANWFSYTAADGQIASTTADMGAYVRFMLNRGATPQGRLLSPAAFQTFITPTLENYGYGVEVTQSAGRTIVSHGGAIYGFNSYLEAHLDEGFGLTFMSNASLDWKLVSRVIRIVSTALGGNGQPAASLPVVAASEQDLDDTSRYEGKYQRKDGAFVTVAKAAMRALLVERPDGKRFELMRLGDDIYGSRQAGAYLFFSDPQHPERGAQEISHGADWYKKDGAPADTSPAAPADYRAYVGRYRNHSDEGPDYRVFVRGGRLAVAPVQSAAYASELEPVSPGVFRPASPAHSPDRFLFDTVDDGVTLRLQMSGVPLYRLDTP
jgi:D-alanyl-D-alanine carboxypeptidase